MSKNKIISHGGVTLNLATIKSFKLQSNIDIGKTNILVIEHKTRFEYIENPNNNNYQKQKYNESTEVEYSSYSVAEAYMNEWQEIWQDYLNE